MKYNNGNLFLIIMTTNNNYVELKENMLVTVSSSHGQLSIQKKIINEV